MSVSWLQSPSGPEILPPKPWMMRSPPIFTKVTLRDWPGSKRTADPAGMSSRKPRATARSKSSAALVSKKWKWLPTWIGRSPLLATVSRTVSRPSFSSSSPAWTMSSPGIIAAPSADRVVDGDELDAVRKGRLDLDFLDHLRDAVHDLGPCQHG